MHARLGRTIGNPAAKSAIDMAVWDALGKTIDLPVTSCSAVTPTGCGSPTWSASTRRRPMVAEAERVRDTYGITTFKVKVGRRPFDPGHRRRPRPARGARPRHRALRRRQPRLDAVRVGPSAARRWPIWASPSPKSSAPPTTCSAAAGWSSTARSPSSPTRARSPPPTSPGRSWPGPPPRSASRWLAPASRPRSRIHHLCEGLGLEVVMGNQIDGQLGSMCTVAFGAAFELTSRRAGELSNFLDMTDDLLDRTAHHLGRRARGTTRRRLGRRDRRRQARALPPALAHSGRTHRPKGGHMTTQTTNPVTETATAAASGANATERFFADKQAGAAHTPPERVDLLAREVLAAVHDTIRKHQVTYAEYNALKAWLITRRRGRRVAAVPRRVDGARRRGGRHRAPARQQRHHRGPLLRAERPRLHRNHDRADARRRSGHSA